MSHTTPATADHASPNFRLLRDAQRRLVLVDADGRQHADVEPVRCFPISFPEQWISICDAQGKELVSVRHLAALEPDVRQILEEELGQHEFVPIVQKIVEMDADSDCCRWCLETDRGLVRFQTVDENAVRRLDAQRAMIVDAAGIRYLIPSLAQLDRDSRRIIEQYC